MQSSVYFNLPQFCVSPMFPLSGHKIQHVDFGQNAGRFAVLNNDQGVAFGKGGHGVVERGFGRVNSAGILHQAVNGLVLAVFVAIEQVIEQIYFVQRANQRTVRADDGHLRNGVLAHDRHHLAGGIAQAGSMQGFVGFGLPQVAQADFAKLKTQEAVFAHPLVVVKLGKVARAAIRQDDDRQTAFGQAAGIFDRPGHRRAARTARKNAFLAHQGAGGDETFLVVNAHNLIDQR
jgi:hypothetical protein